jgi:tetratricopeptide (TPR) repeat protein
MSTMDTSHLRINGALRADRLAVAAEVAPGAVVARTHRHLRGPYTGVDTVLRAVLPDAAARWPELVEFHRVELLHGMPELSELIGPAPVMLATSAPYAQRTRFYQLTMLRSVNHGIVTFLRAYSAARIAAGDDPLTLVFEDVQEADYTTAEMIALLVRRCTPATLRVLVGHGPGELLPELARVLDRHTVSVDAPTLDRPEESRSTAELVAAYVRSDGTSDDPAELAAYQAAEPDAVARLHDERADELAALPGGGNPVGAIPYHREHGTDPAGAGAGALMSAMQFCVETGCSAAIVEYGRRGRAVVDPVAQRMDYCNFTLQVMYASVDMGELTESIELCMELRRRYTMPKVQMVTSYAIAMIYTRFMVPRDHELALAWQNNAIALAALLPDPEERRVQIGFQDNGLALVEMHRGQLDHALELVESGIARLDRELTTDEWALHRTQLLFNRARLLVAMRRPDDAYADFTLLIELDPYFTDYLTERAKVSRRRGELAAALADYDRAVALAPPFPEIYYTRATARLEAGDVAGALADFDYVLDLEPDDVDTRVSRAELYVELGRSADAEQDVLAGLAESPDEPRLLCMLGSIALEADEFERALTHLDAALARDGDYPAALVNRAVARYRLDRLPAAVADLTRVLELVGNDPDVLLNRGLAYHAQERFDLAVRDFDTALALADADVAELRYRRGHSLLAAGRRDQASADLRECARLGEHIDDVRELLAGVVPAGPAT